LKGVFEEELAWIISGNLLKERVDLEANLVLIIGG
jgi:hypothetical protein